MVRPAFQLHPPRTPAPLEPAVTLLLLRDGPAGLQVLMTRRNPNARFAPGAHVFPGGAIDPSDAQALALCTHRPDQDAAQCTVAAAALRECFEEVGVALARTADGRWATAADLAALDRRAPLWEQAARHAAAPPCAPSARAHAGPCKDQATGQATAPATSGGLRWAVDAVWPLAHWQGDRDLPRRFDVPFLVARMPPHQEAVADGQEQFDATWVAPADALAHHQQGHWQLIYPTLKTLEHLQHLPTVDAVLQACQGGPIWPTRCPRTGLRNGQPVRLVEGEPAFGELSLVCPDGQPLHPLDWDPTRPTRLLRHVQRLTAANAGLMTGPGTNSYIVGTPETGHVVIDPGPNQPEHIERLWQAAGGDIRAIVCTHSHPDHSPGARPLQALCAQRGAAERPPPPVLGRSSGPHARADSRFTPDRELQNTELITLTSRAADAFFSINIEVLHTPGHTENHVCLLMTEDGLLFSGDHVLNGSTTVIDPPDGCMQDYLDSLDRLMSACDRQGVSHILPAHGHVLDHPQRVLAHLKAHRLAREARVRDALQALPQGSPADWVRLAYPDLPEALRPVAQRSLLAHVARIRALDGADTPAKTTTTATASSATPSRTNPTATP